VGSVQGEKEEEENQDDSEGEMLGGEDKASFECFSSSSLLSFLPFLS